MIHCLTIRVLGGLVKKSLVTMRCMVSRMRSLWHACKFFPTAPADQISGKKSEDESAFYCNPATSVPPSHVSFMQQTKRPSCTIQLYQFSREYILWGTHAVKHTLAHAKFAHCSSFQPKLKWNNDNKDTHRWRSNAFGSYSRRILLD